MVHEQIIKKLILIGKELLMSGVLSIIFMYAANINNMYILIACIMFLLILNTIYSLTNIRERIIFFIFQITFFTFLVGRLLIYYIFPDNNLFIFGFDFSDEMMRHILISIFISLIFVRLGYVLTETFSNKINLKVSDYETPYNKSIKRIARVLMYLTLLPQLIILIEKAMLVQQLGYEAYYTDYVSELPFIIIKLGLLYEPMTYLFLATMPSKKECKLPLIIFFIVGCFSLGYGQRNGFLLSSIFILIYLFVRDQINSCGKIWFKRKYVFSLIVLIPFLFTFLLAFGSYRSGQKFESASLVDNAALFFFSQGNSASLIGFAKEHENEIPENKFYSFGPAISFLKENAVAKVFFDVPQYGKMTPELAMDGHAFSYMISYLQNPGFYMQGGGLGSCYIAELWVDFGYIGIILGSLVFGILMALFISFCKKNVWLTTIAFSGALMIIYAPRAEFTGFLQILLSFGNLLTFILIYFMAKNYQALKSQILNINHSKMKST